MRKESPHIGFALNGLSIHSMSISQDGSLEVEFDLPQEQTTSCWYTYRRGSRTFDVYEDEDLQEACRQLFQLVRRRVMRPEPEREEIHCDRCRDSACCRKYNVLLRDADVERLARHLEMPEALFRKKFTTSAVDWCGDYSRQLTCDTDADGEEKCVFLKQDEQGLWRCSVYEQRPQICRDFDMLACDDFVALEDVETLQSS
ncbi:MAG: YkgJ family cysteine cluster protein [Planctomycetes bacterium]|nr:YkgJ family cysteine cluster protein [Planctomycetota bacterium]